MLDFEEIENCFPESGALCVTDGRVTVSVQWLHDFANKVAEKERKASVSDLRNHFAGLAMQGILASGDVMGAHDIAEFAYTQADSMLQRVITRR